MTDQNKICWHLHDITCRGLGHKHDRHFTYGRCRSGHRWFWAVCDYNNGFAHTHGWQDTEQAALEAARADIVRLAEGCDASAGHSARTASRHLKEINEKKRAARPPSDTVDAKPVEYLYGCSSYQDDMGEWVENLYRFRIIKKTAKRVFYFDEEEYIDLHGDFVGIRNRHDGNPRFIDRQKLEEKGVVENGGHWCRRDGILWASLEGMLAARVRTSDGVIDIRDLKAAMAAAHPDHGGTSEKFIAARRTYIEARRRERR